MRGAKTSLRDAALRKWIADATRNEKWDTPMSACQPCSRETVGFIGVNHIDAPVAQQFADFSGRRQTEAAARNKMDADAVCRSARPQC